MGEWSPEAYAMFVAIRENKKNKVRTCLKSFKKAAEQHGSSADPRDKRKAQREFALVARVYMEFHRNGWNEGPDESASELIEKAEAALDASLAIEPHTIRDYYVRWKKGYVLRYKARSASGPNGWATTMTESLQYCDVALTAPGITDHASRSIRVDQAETLVYMGSPQQAVTLIKGVLSEPYNSTDRRWHRWAYAFALQQAGEPDSAAQELEQICHDHDNQDMYNNDIRLLLAAAHQDCGNSDRAGDVMKRFLKNQHDNGENPWTLSDEIDRGAFEKDGDPEKKWRATLEAAGLR